MRQTPEPDLASTSKSPISLFVNIDPLVLGRFHLCRILLDSRELVIDCTIKLDNLNLASLELERDLKNS